MKAYSSIEVSQHAIGIDGNSFREIFDCQFVSFDMELDGTSDREKGRKYKIFR